MSHFASNLALLRTASEAPAARMELHRAQIGEPAQLGPYAVEPAKDGMPSVRYNVSGQSFYLHSPYEPRREGEQYAASTLKPENTSNAAVTARAGCPIPYRSFLGWSYFSTARNASWGISTLPIIFIRALPLRCLSSSLRLREMSPP